MTMNFNEVTTGNFKKSSKIVDEIVKHLAAIENDTKFYSYPDPVLNHPRYKMLIEMGDKIVPYLFHHITHNGGSWTIFYLLYNITKQNPIPKEHSGNFNYAIIYWLQWFMDSDYYKNDDIYYGLHK